MKDIILRFLFLILAGEIVTLYLMNGGNSKEKVLAESIVSTPLGSPEPTAEAATETPFVSPKPTAKAETPIPQPNLPPSKLMSL